MVLVGAGWSYMVVDVLGWCWVVVYGGRWCRHVGISAGRYCGCWCWYGGMVVGTVVDGVDMVVYRSVLGLSKYLVNVIHKL